MIRWLVLVLCCTGALLPSRLWGAAAAAPSAAVSSVLDLSATHPELSRALTTIRANDPELAQYLGSPDTVCTFVAPTNQAMQQSVQMLGRYAGKAAQDVKFVTTTLNHHVIPGRALRAEELGRLNMTATRANQTLFTWNKRGKDYVYFREEYPLLLNKTNIKAGKCLVHTIDMALVPPTLQPQIYAWLDELGTWPPKAPKAAWAPQRQPLPDSIEAQQAPAANSLDTASTKGAASEGAGNATGRAKSTTAGSGKPASSSAGSVGVAKATTGWLWQAAWGAVVIQVVLLGWV